MRVPRHLVEWHLPEWSVMVYLLNSCHNVHSTVLLHVIMLDVVFKSVFRLNGVAPGRGQHR